MRMSVKWLSFLLPVLMLMSCSSMRTNSALLRSLLGQVQAELRYADPESEERYRDLFVALDIAASTLASGDPLDSEVLNRMLDEARDRAVAEINAREDLSPELRDLRSSRIVTLIESLRALIL